MIDRLSLSIFAVEVDGFPYSQSKEKGSLRLKKATPALSGVSRPVNSCESSQKIVRHET